MTAALEEGEWSAARPGRTLPLGKTRYPFYRRLGGPQGRSGRTENLVPTGIRSRTVQLIVSRYTDYKVTQKRGSKNYVQNQCPLLAINCFAGIYLLELPYHLKYIHVSEILSILSEWNYDKINEGKFCGACGTKRTERDA